MKIENICVDLMEYKQSFLQKIIRKIKKIFNSEDLDGFFQTLDVDNIRYNQNTLVPFPFKYLREYKIIQKYSEK